MGDSVLSIYRKSISTVAGSFWTLKNKDWIKKASLHEQTRDKEHKALSVYQKGAKNKKSLSSKG